MLNASVFGGFPAGRHPSPRAFLGDRLRQAHGRGRDPVEQDPRYGVGEARRLPVPSRAAVGAGGAAPSRSTAARSSWPITATSTASGGTQDVTSVIEEAMKQGLEDACAGPICDPQPRRADDPGRRRRRGDARARRQDRHAGHGPEGQAAQGDGQGQGHHRRPVRRHRTDGHRHHGAHGPHRRARHRQDADRRLRAARRALRPRRLHPLRHRSAGARSTC